MKFSVRFISSGLGLFLIFCSQFKIGNSTFLIASSEDTESGVHEIHHRNRRSAVDIPSNYSSIEIPPTSNNGPLNVKMSIVIMNLRDIKEIGEEMSIELNIRIYWKDSRLSHLVEHLTNSQSETNKPEFILLPPSLIKSVWSPDLFIDHVKKVEQPTILSQTASLRMYPDNTLRYSARLTITISCPMDFHFYPADTQRCHFDVKSYAYSDSKVMLAWRDKNGAVFSSDVDLSNFFTGLDNPTVFTQKTQTGNSYSALRFTVLLTRKLSYHLMQTYLPSVILVIVSWLSFLINSDSVPGRMTVLMTCLLTLIAMFASVRQSTPNVSYVKFIDLWMVVCVLFVFLALMEFTLVLKIKTMKFKKKEEPAPQSPIDNLQRSAPRGGLATSVYYPNPVPLSHRRPSNSRGQSIEEDETELTEYGTPWRSSSDYSGGTVAESIQRRPPLGIPGDYPPGVYSRSLPLKPQPQHYQNMDQFLTNEPPSSPPPPPQPPSISRNEEIISKVEHTASIIIPILFICYNIVYWPWLIISSEYFEQAGGGDIIITG